MLRLPLLCPLPFPSRLLKARFALTIFAFYALQCLKILWVFEFYFTIRDFSLCLRWLSLGVSGTEVLRVCFISMPGECYPSQRREETLMPGVLSCGTKWSDSLMFLSLPSSVRPLVFLAVVAMYPGEKHPGCAVVTWLLRVKLRSLNGVI